jgi:hypothetical protein
MISMSKIRKIVRLLNTTLAGNYEILRANIIVNQFFHQNNNQQMANENRLVE